MGKIKRKVAADRRNKHLRQHKRSVLIVISALLLLVCVVSVDSISLYAKNKLYKEQQAELEKLIAEEDQRAEDIEEFERYVQTKEYIEDTAKEKLGLAHKNEILFKAEK